MTNFHIPSPATPPLTAASDQSDALLARLGRLEGYLKIDPGNPVLRTEVFEVAMHAGAFDKAQLCVREAQASGSSDIAGWRFREATLHIAQGRYDAANLLLRELLGDSTDPAIIYDLAYVAFCQQQFEQCVSLLRPFAEKPVVAPLVQVLWLRSLHQCGLLEEARLWCAPRIGANALTAAAAGVASLIYVDSTQLHTALQLATHALQNEPIQMEALVARATIALGQKDSAGARRLLNQALHNNPKDGRSWSALGFVELLETHVTPAVSCFRQAVQFMPRHIGTWHGLGWACFMAHDYAGARQAFETALALDRNFGESHGAVAIALASLGERESAESYIKRALALDKNGLSAHYAQAILSGVASDAQAIRRIAQGLLAGRQAPMGGPMSDLLPPEAA